MDDRLKKNLAEWMISHGEVISDRQQSNYYTGVRIVVVTWRRRKYRIVQVDGMTCLIEKI